MLMWPVYIDVSARWRCMRGRWACFRRRNVPGQLPLLEDGPSMAYFTLHMKIVKGISLLCSHLV